jgi:hypothetical protein
MKAIGALQAARAAGIELEVNGDDLVLGADSKPSAEVLEDLVRHKAEIVAWLRLGQGVWSAEDWRAFFDERAGIAEFNAGLSRAQAEARAFACCIVEWLNRNPAPSPSGRCLGCGGQNQAHDPLLPYGVEPTGHAWLHSRCWPAWYASRKAEATAALAAMGIDRPDSLSRTRQFGLET